MPLFGRREVDESASIDAEHDRLRAIRISAEEELGRLRKELTERVGSVEKKERQLADAIAKAGRGGMVTLPAGADEALVHARVSLAARSQELSNREKELSDREKELAARERAIVQEEAALARKSGTPDAEARLAQVETRLAALQQAEQAFARTRAELAAQSDELAQRELALLEHGRLIEAAAASSGIQGTSAVAAGMSRAELDELDERLRRLEQQTRTASEERSFGDGLRTLERRGISGTQT